MKLFLRLGRGLVPRQPISQSFKKYIKIFFSRKKFLIESLKQTFKINKWPSAAKVAILFPFFYETKKTFLYVF